MTDRPTHLLFFLSFAGFIEKSTAEHLRADARVIRGAQSSKPGGTTQGVDQPVQKTVKEQSAGPPQHALLGLPAERRLQGEPLAESLEAFARALEAIPACLHRNAIGLEQIDSVGVSAPVWDGLRVKLAAIEAAVGVVGIVGRGDRVVRSQPIRAAHAQSTTPQATGKQRENSTEPTATGLSHDAEFRYRRPKPKVAASFVSDSYGAALSRERQAKHFHSEAETARRKRYEAALLVDAPPDSA